MFTHWWEELPGRFRALDAIKLPNPNLHFQILDSLTDVSQEGKEVLRGVRINKIAGNVDMAQQVKETNEPLELPSPSAAR